MRECPCILCTQIFDLKVRETGVFCKRRFTIDLELSGLKTNELVQQPIACSKLTIETLEQGVKLCSKLTVKTPEHRHRSGVFIFNFEHIRHLVLVFLLLTLSRWMRAGNRWTFELWKWLCKFVLRTTSV